MASFEITEVEPEYRTWTAKKGPAAGQEFHSYTVVAKGPDGAEKTYEISRKPTSGAPQLGPVEADVQPSAGDFPDKLKLSYAQNGRQNGSGGSSRAKNDKDDAWWYAKDRRISRAGMLQAVVGSTPIHPEAKVEHIDAYVIFCNSVTDALLASLDERTPHPSGGTDTDRQDAGARGDSSSSRPASTGFASDKQKEFFRRLLTGDSNVKEGIVRYAETMETDRISKAIDAMNGDDPATANAAQKALKDLADEWAKKQSDTPYDPNA